MLGAPLRSGVGWPTSGEIDILEDINGRSSVFGTLHCGTPRAARATSRPASAAASGPAPAARPRTTTTRCEIDRSVSPEQIRWYLDGNNYFTVNSTAVDATTWANAVDHPFFIIYDLAMGGGFPAAFGGGPTASTVSGGQMNIDWVAVYNKGPGSGGGDTTAPSTPTGLTASGTTSTSTNLSWNASTDNVGVTGYDVLRNGTSVATVTGTTYTATGLTPSTAYSFAVRARDAAGNLSGNSNTVNVTTSAGGGGGGNIAQGKPATSSSNENATPRAGERGRRQPRHPVVERVQRSTVDPGRPRAELQHHPRDAELGGGLRPGVPDPDVARRHHVDEHLLHDDRRRRYR